MGLRDGRTTVSKDGDVFASHLVKLHVTCPLIFGKMPFDLQFCPLKIESYWDTSDQVRFSVYNDLPVELNPTASIGGFTVRGGSGKAIVTEFSTGKFSALVLEMYVRAAQGPPLTRSASLVTRVYSARPRNTRPPSTVTSLTSPRSPVRPASIVPSEPLRRPGNSNATGNSICSQ